MNDFALDPITTPHSSEATAALFMWRGAGIVLIGVLEHEVWVLARAWLEDDRLEYVRRWTFPQPVLFSRQVRRLVMEANGDFALARDEAVRALTWAASAS